LSSSFVAAQVFNHLLLSPLLFILLFLISAFFVRAFRWLFVFAALSLYFLSTGLSVKLFLEPLENEFRKAPVINFKPDAVIVLGGGANAYVPDSKLRADSYRRFVEGVMYAKKHDLPIIFAGGGWIDKDGITEAAAAKESADRLAEAFGFAKPATTTLHGGFGIIYDDKSENTMQNAQNSMVIIKQNTMQNPKIVLVTSAFHMKRAKIIFEKNGFNVTAYAVGFYTDGQKLDYMSALPEWGNLRESFVGIHEYLGILKFFVSDKK
jgi:uncharacterized SAM-binding protein YcdF (DUF218 family)